MTYILEHVEKPVALLSRAATWLAPGGRLLVDVPNGLSLHRMVGVKMGLLKEPCELNQRDLDLGHRHLQGREASPTPSRDRSGSDRKLRVRPVGPPRRRPADPPKESQAPLTAPLSRPKVWQAKDLGESGVLGSDRRTRV